MLKEIDALKDRKKKAMDLSIVIGAAPGEEKPMQEDGYEKAPKEMPEQPKEEESMEEDSMLVEEKPEDMKGEDEEIMQAMQGLDDPERVMEEFKDREPRTLGEKVKYAIAMKVLKEKKV